MSILFFEPFLVRNTKSTLSSQNHRKLYNFIDWFLNSQASHSCSFAPVNRCGSSPQHQPQQQHASSLLALGHQQAPLINNNAPVSPANPETPLLPRPNGSNGSATRKPPPPFRPKTEPRQYLPIAKPRPSHAFAPGPFGVSFSFLNIP